MNNKLQKILSYRNTLILVLTPIFLIPLPVLVTTQEAKCAYILLIMAVYWVSEAMPLPATALLPVILVPAFGIMESKAICPAYTKDTIMLFIGGLMVATAVEYRNLHKRIALRVLMLVGTNPKMLMIGFMIPTWFLSMWISNTATTAMMIPIVNAVLEEMAKHDEEEGEEPEITEQIEMKEENPPPLERIPSERNNPPNDFSNNFRKAMNLCICYSATCGGIATLTGTGPNLIMNGIIHSHFGSAAGINFGSWMIYAAPISLVCLILTWLWLLLWFLGPRFVVQCQKSSDKEDRVKRYLKVEYDKLGPITFSEGSCLFFFMLLVVLWITRNPGVEGWSRLFKYHGIIYVVDAQPAIFVALLLYIWPAYNPLRSDLSEEDSNERLLPWDVMQHNLPWGVCFLLGGGFALADACKASGLSLWIGQQLEFMGSLPMVALLFIVTIGSAMLTEITSNSATSSILIPILISLSACIKQNPLYLVLPATIACSFAFCLPVATPPNAIVFAKGHITVPDMAKCGILVNVFTVSVACVATLTYGIPFFGLNNYPDWGDECKSNYTLIANATSSFG